MKKKISVLALASIFVASSAMGSAWRIPEESVDSTAKVGANIASATRTDTAYFNPAKMSWMDDTWQIEVDATYIYLSPIKYEDGRNSFYSSESETEHFLVPTGFVVSPDYSGFRFGLAVVAPYGLSKRWEDPFGKAVAGEFSLAVIEVNPTVSYAISDMISVAAGPRMLYAKATMENDASGLGIPLGTNMVGDTIEWGWNVAVAVKPMDKLDLAVTYRSNVDLKFEDDANLNLMGTLLPNWDADVTVPAPAVFAVSVAYDVLENLNIELTWDRTYWSQYEVLDINYHPNIPGNPFEVPVARDWNDTNAYRIGLTYGLNDVVTLMAGFGYDENPIPTDKVDFSIPDSDAWLYSVGMQYAVNENLDLGIAFLYDYKESRDVKGSPTDRVYGEFTEASALLVSVGLNYKF
ncbi:MAG: aromatic hydrocarbon degradation protein [Desulfotalea sp.]|nr:MAG: aromatic hydrocarbon degradation protein [Desulfotalea sp.]